MIRERGTTKATPAATDPVGILSRDVAHRETVNV